MYKIFLILFLMLFLNALAQEPIKASVKYTQATARIEAFKDVQEKLENVRIIPCRKAGTGKFKGLFRRNDPFGAVDDGTHKVIENASVFRKFKLFDTGGIDQSAFAVSHFDHAVSTGDTHLIVTVGGSGLGAPSL